MKGIAIAGIALSAAYLETHGQSANGLWILVVLWILFGDGSLCNLIKLNKRCSEDKNDKANP